MSEFGPQNTLPRQTWWVAALALALVALAAPIVLGKTPARAPAPVRAPARPTAATVAPSADSTSFAASQPAAVRPSDTPAATSAPTPAAPPPSAAPPRPSEPPRQDHYWLERPLAPGGNDRVERAYPYASRQGGTHPIHHGVEFVNPLGTPVRAVAEGVIVVAGDDQRQVYGARDGFYGLVVIQRLAATLYGQPVFVVYGHLSKVAVAVGAPVAQGDVVGQVGMTGYAEGPHLHLEVRYGANDYGRTLNPELWLRPRPGYGTLAGVVLGPDGAPLLEVPLTLARADAPQIALRYLVTYPAQMVNPDPAWGESFAAGDLLPGDYVVSFSYRNRSFAQTVTVTEGATAWVLLRAGP
ncbi:MAG: M23 family metallopeptidase [Chloroflexota bacterium]